MGNYMNGIYNPTFNKAGNIKIGSMRSWSTVKGDDVLSVDYRGKHFETTGTCTGVCAGCKKACYVNASYRYKNVKYSHICNTIALRTRIADCFDIFENNLKRAKNKPDFVRLNQSGEIENRQQFDMWVQLAKLFPETGFYIYSKKFNVIIPYLLTNIMPNNFITNVSVWHEYGIEEYKKVSHLETVKAFVYDDGFNYNKLGINFKTHCPAYDIKGKMNHNITCDKCGLCNTKKGAKIIGCYDH